MNNVRYCGGNEQERMIANGWRIELPENCRETPEEIYERLSQRYGKVKVYYDTTMVRGYHDYFAMVRQRK